MAFGLIGDSGSAQVNGEILGGLVTGTNGEFLSLPISSTVLGGLAGTTNEWSRFYLSDSFGAASSSLIQALNYLSASIKVNADSDVEGPSSATDNAVVRFDGTTGKLIQNTSVVTISDAGTVAGGAGGNSYGFSATGQISGANAVIAGTTVSGAGVVAAKALTTEEATISVAGVVSGAGAILGQKLTIADSDVITTAGAVAAVTTVSGASSLAGAKLTINGTDVATQAGALVAPTTVSGAGAVSGKSLTTEEATISTAGAYSGSGGIDGQSLTIANLFKATSNGSITGSGLATFSNTEIAQGGGYKPALIISSSEISTAANAALIPRFIIQGTNNAGGLADFMISVSGGMFQVQELSNGTWPL